VTVETLRLHGFLARTQVEGPGLRACVWVQGCSIRCPGCFSPQTWDADGGESADAVQLGERIAADEAIEGVTFLGGEPFEQAAALALVGARARAAGRSVMVFTGYEYEHLRDAGRADWDALLATTDLLVDGPYDWRRPDRVRPWVGSTNQRFHCLTDRYADLWPLFAAAADRVEVHIRPDGRVWINGMCSTGSLRGLRRDVLGALER
jgi:anaerobic ribonucleoside-triphosphate reductase activating protein